MEYNEKQQEQQVIDTMLLMGQPVNDRYIFNKYILQDRLNWLKSEVDELEEGIDNGDLKEILDAIEDTRTVLNGFYPNMGINYNIGREIYSKVTESNQSKICETPEDLKSTLVYYKSINLPVKIRIMYPKGFDSLELYRERFRKVTIELGNDYVSEEIEFTHNLSTLPYYVVVDALSNKYLKNINYLELNIDNILDKIYNNSLFYNDKEKVLTSLGIDSYNLKIAILLDNFESYINDNKGLINNPYGKDCLLEYNNIKDILNEFGSINNIDVSSVDYARLCDSVASLEENLNQLKILNNVK